MEKIEKDRSYYENLYEQKMINRQKYYHENFKKSKKYIEKRALNLLGYFTKMSDYSHREETINKWIEKDRNRDIFYQNTKPTRDIVRCKICNKIMELEDKDFNHGIDGKPDKILFIYRCHDCRKGRAFYNTGEEFETTKEYCDKCGFIIDYTAKFNGDILIKKYSCKSCGNNYTKKEDFSVGKIEKDVITENDIKMYGYNEKEAYEMKEAYDSIDRLHEIVMDSKKEDENKKYIKIVDKLDKYNLFQLEEFINKTLEKSEFKNFKVTNKEHVKTYIKCEFEVYFIGKFGDNSSRIFDKIITELLSNSNWKLQKNKTHEKLGVLNGVFFGYDSKSDLIELVKKR